MWITSMSNHGVAGGISERRRSSCGLVTPYGIARSRSMLAQVMACCLTAPSHYLNQCWLSISKVQWHSSEGSFTRERPQPLTIKISLKITHVKFTSNIPGVSELRFNVYGIIWLLVKNTFRSLIGSSKWKKNRIKEFDTCICKCEHIWCHC